MTATEGKAPGVESPASLLLVHGAGSGPWIFRDWRGAFPGIAVFAMDLHRGLDVTQASHEDYARSVVRAAARLGQPVPLCGWSMGGLVVLQASGRVRLHSVILLEPSPPGEVQGFHLDVPIHEGSFDPEAVYGLFPPGVRARPESSLARAERKRGVSVPALPCPSLVVFGDEFRDQRGRQVARFYDAEELDFPDLSHCDLVSEESVRAGIAGWLGSLRWPMKELTGAGDMDGRPPERCGPPDARSGRSRAVGCPTSPTLREGFDAKKGHRPTRYGGWSPKAA